MAFHTPHGSTRFRLPWSWSSFDYKTLCEALYEQTDARFEIAKVQARRGDTVLTDRGELIERPLIVDALGWRRVLGAGATSSRRTPRSAAASRSTRTAPRPTSTCGSTAAWSATATPGGCPRLGEQRIGVGSYDHATT